MPKWIVLLLFVTLSAALAAPRTVAHSSAHSSAHSPALVDRESDKREAERLASYIQSKINGEAGFELPDKDGNTHALSYDAWITAGNVFKWRVEADWSVGLSGFRGHDDTTFHATFTKNKLSNRVQVVDTSDDLTQLHEDLNRDFYAVRLSTDDRKKDIEVTIETNSHDGKFTKEVSSMSSFDIFFTDKDIAQKVATAFERIITLSKQPAE